MDEIISIREQLNTTLRLHRRLRHDLERREYLMAKATATPALPVGERVQTSPTNNGTLVLDALADLDTEIQAEAAELEREKRKVRRMMAGADLTKEEQEVCGLRYLNGLTWTEIAGLMYWSQRQVQRIHGTALAKIGTRWHALAHSDTQEP